jgi:hypothetical protein
MSWASPAPFRSLRRCQACWRAAAHDEPGLRRGEGEARMGRHAAGRLDRRAVSQACGGQAEHRLVETRSGSVVELVRPEVVSDTLAGLESGSAPGGTPLRRVAIPLEQVERIGSKRGDARRIVAAALAGPLAHEAGGFLMGWYARVDRQRSWRPADRPTLPCDGPSHSARGVRSSSRSNPRSSRC